MRRQNATGGSESKEKENSTGEKWKKEIEENPQRESRKHEKSAKPQIPLEKKGRATQLTKTPEPERKGEQEDSGMRKPRHH